MEIWHETIAGPVEQRSCPRQNLPSKATVRWARLRQAELAPLVFRRIQLPTSRLSRWRELNPKWNLYRTGSNQASAYLPSATRRTVDTARHMLTTNCKTSNHVTFHLSLHSAASDSSPLSTKTHSGVTQTALQSLKTPHIPN